MRSLRSNSLLMAITPGWKSQTEPDSPSLLTSTKIPLTKSSYAGPPSRTSNRERPCFRRPTRVAFSSLVSSSRFARASCSSCRRTSAASRRVFKNDCNHRIKLAVAETTKVANPKTSPEGAHVDAISGNLNPCCCPKITSPKPIISSSPRVQPRSNARRSKASNWSMGNKPRNFYRDFIRKTCGSNNKNWRQALALREGAAGRGLFYLVNFRASVQRTFKPDEIGVQPACNGVQRLSVANVQRLYRRRCTRTSHTAVRCTSVARFPMAMELSPPAVFATFGQKRSGSMVALKVGVVAAQDLLLPAGNIFSRRLEMQHFCSGEQRICLPFTGINTSTNNNY